MEPATAAVRATPEQEGADEPTTAERLELLADELREAIRRKVEQLGD
ncbi:MAG TPA: hypothetical protein VFI37_04580 [Gaiellaceae bacterium]|jgi:hypothetical protein|nr:hypothetical protein [Gaiellaceae bacterium]